MHFPVSSTASISQPAFCWTRIGTEAGQTLSDIVSRKELERRATGGIFVWGIGNAVAPAVSRLLDLEPNPSVLFSPIKSAPAAIDVQPTSLLAWTGYLDSNGLAHELPDGVVVTSRGHTARGAAKRAHYALFCRSETSLGVEGVERIDFDRLRNL